jgi:hypothetical protein
MKKLILILLICGPVYTWAQSVSPVLGPGSMILKSVKTTGSDTALGLRGIYIPASTVKLMGVDTSSGENITVPYAIFPTLTVNGTSNFNGPILGLYAPSVSTSTTVG